MRLEPPAQLVAALERLGLAAAADFARVNAEVTRLARELPPFDALWIDALARARVLTPYQAAELHAGRADALRVGPFILCRAIAATTDAKTFRAKHAETGAIVRLSVAHLDEMPDSSDAVVERLSALVARGQRWDKEHTWPALDRAAVATAAGVDAGRLWAAAPWVEGRSIAEQLARCGRFPPTVVEAIARPLVALLAELEEAGLSHGRLTANAVLLTDRGGVVVLDPGLHAALQDIGVGDDRRACGRLLWQMLCGREPPEDRIIDPRRLAPQTSAALADVVVTLRRDDSTTAAREDHPLSPDGSQLTLWTLAERLPRSSDESRRAIVRFLRRRRRPTENWYASFLVRQPPVFDLGPWLKPAASLAATAVLLAIAWLSVQWLYAPYPATELAEAAVAHETAPNSKVTTSEPRALPRATEPVNATQPNEHATARSASPSLVQPTTYIEPTAKPPVAKRPLDLVLDASRPIDVAKLKFQPGQRVRGLSRQRPLLIVPAGGLTIPVEDVCFENIDFAVSNEAKQNTPLLRVEAARVEFCGCTFTGRTPQAERDAYTGPAIAWSLPQSDNAFASLPTGRITLIDCTFAQVDAAIACQGRGARACEIANVLHLGRGPLLKLIESPRQDEPLRLTLSRLTLRESGPLVDCGGEDGAPPLTIAADACVFSPREGQPLVSLTGGRAPKALTGLTWTGQSSLLAADTPFAAWCGGQGETEPLDDAAVSVAGLVRSRIEFAGKASDGPAASRAIHWLAPLPTADAPGIDARRLASPPAPPTNRG